MNPHQFDKMALSILSFTIGAFLGTVICHV